MPPFGLRFFDSHQGPDERRRVGLLYAAAFCLLMLAIDLNRIYSDPGGEGSLVSLLPVIAVLTGALAFVILHASSPSPDRTETRRADLARLRAAPVAGSESDRASRDTLERLASFTQWRRSRASKFEEYGMTLPEVDGPKLAPTSAPRTPKGREAANVDKKVDVWAKVLQDFDGRNSDKRS